MKKTNILVLRWRLWRVCKKLGIKPYKWQKDYALGKITSTIGGRRSGKTTAVMLWALARKKCSVQEIVKCAYKDPDTTDRSRMEWWCREYVKMASRAGLPAAGKSFLIVRRPSVNPERRKPL